ncbi:transmembrane proteins 14C-domain-containing protein [Hypoxylon sp. FL1150]|nr:transmembrane proteins 14C-domain-containing protein [Hypoxylon sp. FL1150]
MKNLPRYLASTVLKEPTLRSNSNFINSSSDPHSEKMSLPNIAYVLGTLTAGGGTMGFVRTGSIPSIAAGLTVGLLYGLGGYRLQSRQPYGVELALLASIVLGGSSIPRAIRLGKPVPIVLSLISVFGILTFGNAFRKTL